MSADVLKLVQLIEEVSGIVVPERDHAALLAFAEDRLRVAQQPDVDRYVRSLRLDRSSAEWRALLSSITVKESYLYRAPQHFKALGDVALPELRECRRDSPLRVWSAGCARGEEASTLAIVLSDSAALEGRDWRVTATDVDASALEEARRGEYGSRAVAHVPAEVMAQHFVRRGDRFALDPSLLRHIEYRTLNLVSDPLEVNGAPFDIIFLRNVLIYFRPELQRRVAEAVVRAMAPQGYLFLGPSESLWQICPILTAVDLVDCFCYRWPQPDVAKPGGAPSRSVRERRWTSAHAAAAARLPRAGSSAEKAARVRSARPSRDDVVETIVTTLENGEAADGLLRARAAVQRYPEDASLRAYEGLALDVMGDHEGAIGAYRASLYLDSTLFQVRFLLARCMDRLGWGQRAMREQRQVLAMMRTRDAGQLRGADRLSVPTREQIFEACRSV